MSMGWVAAGTAVLGTAASMNAADKQAAAARDSNALQKYQYDTTRKDQKPYREAGYEALGTMRTGLQPGGDFNRDFTLADFQKDPGYQFRLDQGEQAINRSASAGSGQLSGATLKALIRYNQDYGSGEWDKSYNRFNNDRTTRFNRQASMAGVGQTANNQIAAAGQAYANNASNNLMGAANSRAAGYIGAANATGNAVGQYINYNQNQSMMNALMNNKFGGNNAIATPVSSGVADPNIIP